MGTCVYRIQYTFLNLTFVEVLETLYRSVTSRSGIQFDSFIFRLQSHSGNVSAAVNSKQEVVLGMADPVDSNRVYMTSDHALVIRDLASSDIGRYSCIGFGSDEHVEFALDLLPEVDRVMAVSVDSMADWTLYESRYFAPVVEKFPQMVRKMGVDWDPWGPCDGCAGKRYRRAACRVKFDDGTRMACRYVVHTSPALYNIHDIELYLLFVSCASRFSVYLIYYNVDLLNIIHS